MLNYSPRVTTGTIDATCAELSTPKPKGYTERLAQAELINTNLAKFSTAGTAGELISTVFDELAAGRHPADSEAVRRLALMTQLQGYELHRTAEDRAKGITAAAVAEFADHFVADWAKATEADGEILLAVAHTETFADVTNLADMHPSQLVKPADHQAWISASVAERRLNAAASGVTSLLASVALRYRPELRVLIMQPDLTLDELDEIKRDLLPGQKADAWHVARVGRAPKLCGSVGDFVAAVGRIGAEHAHRQAEAEEQAAPVGFSGGRRNAELTGR